MAEHAKIHPEQHWTPGLEDWIDELDILSIDKCGHDGEIQRFRCTLDGREFIGNVECGGFGMPYLILADDEIELCLIESDDYEHDGSEPVKCTGWNWEPAGSADLQLEDHWGYQDVCKTLAEALASLDN